MVRAIGARTVRRVRSGARHVAEETIAQLARAMTGGRAVITRLRRRGQLDRAARPRPTSPSRSKSHLPAAMRSGLVCWTRVRAATRPPRPAARAVAALSHFAIDHADRLEELDINPLIVTETGAVAADALIRIRKET